MNYKFPVINHIDDVLPHIQDKPEFIVIDKDDYTVIDYVLQTNETFPNVVELTSHGYTDSTGNAILRECRGLIFDKQGKIISRAFHKFFNYGEKPAEQDAMGAPAYMLDKLDGSMIRPLVIDGDIRLATRKGVTDVAMQAETFAAGKENYITFISAMVCKGLTPIFEWCSRKNQIVLDYPEDQLVLLAIRDTVTGEYFQHQQVIDFATSLDIPVVKMHDVLDFGAVKGDTDKEGYVFVWENGHKLKAKSDWYVTLHRAKDAIGREKDLIKVFLTTGVDDILPILPEAYKAEVSAFLAKLTEKIFLTCEQLDAKFVRLVEKMPEDKFTRKDFAKVVLEMDTKYKYFMFKLLEGTQAADLVIPALIKACSSKKTLDEYRWLFGGIRFGDKLQEE